MYKNNNLLILSYIIVSVISVLTIFMKQVFEGQSILSTV